MRRRWILRAALCAALMAPSFARAGSLAPIKGPLDPGNILQTLNQLVVNINAQILASGTGSLASALSIPLVTGATPGSDNALIITPSAPGDGVVTLQAGGVDTNVALALQTQGTGDLNLSGVGGLVSLPVTMTLPARIGGPPMTLGNQLAGYGPMGAGGPPTGWALQRVVINGVSRMVVYPVWVVSGSGFL